MLLPLCSTRLVGQGRAGAGGPTLTSLRLQACGAWARPGDNLNFQTLTINLHHGAKKKRIFHTHDERA